MQDVVEGSRNYNLVTPVASTINDKKLKTLSELWDVSSGHHTNDKDDSGDGNQPGPGTLPFYSPVLLIHARVREQKIYLSHDDTRQRPAV